MAFENIGAPAIGSELQKILDADDIQPGSDTSYQMAKIIYGRHPLGGKIVDFPLQMAQYKPRKITVPKAPGDGEMMVEAFNREWREIQADRHIMNHGRLASIYGIATLGIIEKDADTKTALEFQKLDGATISFSVFDPLNTAGSLVLNQDPNALDFQKVTGFAVSGKAYHRSRGVVLMNEDPLYIAYENAGFGFVGRSVFQRGLFPLKSFVSTMITDAMVAIKAGVLVAKMKSPSSAVDAPMAWLFAQKRDMVKEAQTNNVLSIGVEEDIQSIDLKNLEAPYMAARRNIIENIASACGRPAKVLLAETFAEGFGEGTEDAKAIAQFVDGIRTWLQPSYDFLTEIVMYRAWNEEFFERVKAVYPEVYEGMSYAAAFQTWRNSFHAEWPSLLDEPESEKIKTDEVVLRAIISIVEVLMPVVPPSEKAKVIEFLCENVNMRKRLFTSPLEIDYEEVAAYEPPAPVSEFRPSRPEGFADSAAPKPSSKLRGAEILNGVDAEVRKSAIAALRLVKGAGVDGVV